MYSYCQKCPPCQVCTKTSGVWPQERATIINKHTTALAKALFTGRKDVLIFILDGTYIFIQKSRNYKLQTFSTYKGDSLGKLMILTTSTGSIMTVVWSWTLEKAVTMM